MGCTGVFQKSSATPTSVQYISENEYAVYRALIEACYIQRETQLIVIQDHTGVEMLDLSDQMENLINNFSNLSADMIADFRLKNQQTWLLDNNLELDIPIRLLSEDEFHQIFTSQDGWKQFYAQYPGSQGVMTLSRVGFNTKMDKALVYVGNQSYWLAGEGFYLLLALENGHWNVIGEEMVWIS